MLEFRKVEKLFPGVRALKGIDFEVKKGEVVGLGGENGAGKSTLMKVIYGAYQHDGGEVLVNGRPTRLSNPREAMQAGIGMVFQEQSLIPSLSVMENIFLGFEQQFVNFGVIRWKRMAEAARRQLAKVHLDVDPYATTSALSFAPRQMVELAEGLARGGGGGGGWQRWTWRWTPTPRPRRFGSRSARWSSSRRCWRSRSAWRATSSSCWTSRLRCCPGRRAACCSSACARCARARPSSSCRTGSTR